MEHTSLKPLFDQLRTIIKGKDEAIHDAITCLVAGGHLLIEDIPGVGKTTLAYAVAKVDAGRIFAHSIHQRHASF